MVELRAIDDVDEQKKWIDKYITEAFTNKILKGKSTTLVIENPKIGFKDYSLAEQKQAILNNKNLSRPVVGDLKLVDNETNKVIGTRKGITLAQAPYHTGRNAIISNGSSFSNPANQIRLRPGAYTRRKSNGEIETHFNLVSGTGSGFRVNLEPETGIFNLNLQTLNAPLYPFLKAMDVQDSDLEKAWGSQVLEANKAKGGDISKFYPKLVPYGNPNLDNTKKVEAILNVFEKAKMDKDVNVRTLGEPLESAGKDALVASTKKILAVNKGEQEEDDRDSPVYKKFYSAEDFYKEKLAKDAGSLGKKLMIRMDKYRDLKKFPPGYFSKQLWGVIKSDPSVSPTGTLSQPTEEINPVDMYDQHHKVTLLGEGGIGDMHVVTMEARNVHPSEFGFIDNIRTPESANVGIDKRLAWGVKKGTDNNLYREFINVKTGKGEYLTPMQALDKTIAFPGEWESKKDILEAMDKGKLSNVPRKSVEYYLKSAIQQFSTYDNMVPMPEAIQGNRMILAGKAIGLTMPIVNGDAPLVQNMNTETGNSFEKDIANKVVNKLSKVSGIVEKVTPDNIYVKTSDGKSVRHGLFNNFPLNLKTSITNTAIVKPGDKVSKGTLMATSNYSNSEGVLSMGKNLRSVYMPWKGWNFEDGIVLSESAAKKLTSEQFYQYEYDIDDPEGKVVNKQRYMGMFPNLYGKDIMAKMDTNGVIKPGTIVKPGEPLILAMEKRPPSSRDIQLGNLHKNLKNQFRNGVIDWNHHSDGIVTDIAVTGKRVKVFVKTQAPAHIGDKLTGRFGNKGVVSLILPDDKMPVIGPSRDKAEIILNPVGVPSRINPAQIHEALLGKVAMKTGKPYILQSFKYDDLKTDLVDKEVEKYGVTKEDDVEADGRTLSKVFNGYSYIWKLAKMSEGELKKRDIGGYDMDQQPIKGKSESGQALKLGSMEINTFIGHGVPSISYEQSTIKGQKNDQFWRALKLGYTLPSPQVPFVYNKFLTMLKGSGINVKKEGTQQHLMPLIDKDILKLSSGRIEKPELLYTKNLQPIKGGLFDVGITGGTAGQKWSHITLTEPVPNPVMEEPIKKILRINQTEFERLIRENKLKDELGKIHLDNELKTDIDSFTGSKKNNETKRLAYLKTLKDNDIKPSELMLSNIPVIPPVFRPISVVGTKETVSPGSSNVLYKDLLLANSILAANKQELPDSELSSERLSSYKAVKAVVGLGDSINVKNKNKGIQGFIADIVGDQPKTGYFQKKVFNKTQDLVSRAVAAPDPTLSMDQISIPEESAWKTYKPFLLRRMIQNGISAVSAEKEIEARTDRAKHFLEAEMKERPIMMNRNPSLHKYNIMSFFPIMNHDSVIKVSPPIVTGFALDFDGDQINLHVPVTPEAVREAKEKMLPSKNLLHMQNKKVHYLPAQGAILGLYSISKPPESKQLAKKYDSIEAMKEDFNKGLIKATDLVQLR